MMKKILVASAKIGVSAGLLYFLFRKSDIGAFRETVSSLDVRTVLLAALIFLGTQCVATYRWSTVLKKDVRIPYPKLLSVYMIGMFFNNFLPTIVGGDIIKGYYLYRDTGKGDVSFASILMDRYSGYTALMFITLVALVPGYVLIKGTGLPLFFLLLVGGYLLASFFLWVDTLHAWLVRLLAKVRLFDLNEKIDKFYNVLMSYKGHPGILLRIFLLSLVVQLGVIASYVVLGRGLGIDVPVGYYFLFIPLATTVSMMPVSLAGLGIREGAFVFLFAKAGVAQEQALGLSLVWFAIVVAISLVGGVEYVRAGGKKGKEGKKFGPEAEGQKTD